MPECRGAPKESKPARLNSAPFIASRARVPPAPPYSSGIAGQRSPAAPALFQTSRSYLPSSFQVSRCGTYSAAMKRRACSSSSTRSSVIQPGRGRLRTFMSNPVDRTAYRAPPHYARATSVDKRLPLFHNGSAGGRGTTFHATRQFAIERSAADQPRSAALPPGLVGAIDATRPRSRGPRLNGRKSVGQGRERGQYPREGRGLRAV